MRKYKSSTIMDVALKAGVSRSTAGHILRNKPPMVERFSEETRALVQSAARELGYRPNFMASGLRSGKSRLMALIVNGPWLDPMQSSEVSCDIKAAQWGLVAAMVRRVRERGRLPLMDLLNCDHTEQEDTEIIRHLTGCGIGGVIIKSPHPNVNPLIRELNDEAFPIVSLFPQSHSHLEYNWLDTDNIQCGRLAAEHLLSRGYRRFHWVMADENEANRTRYRGYLQALTEAGYGDQVSLWEIFHPSYDEHIRRLKGILSMEKPMGLVTADASAHKVVHAAQLLGLSLVTDIGLVGHDCHLWHEAIPVRQITNITVSQEIAGRAAVDMACDLLEQEEPRLPPVLLMPELHQGDTTSGD